MKLYLVRHGESNYNVLGLCNDDPADDVSLTAKRRAQAENVAVRLQDAAFEHIFVSELPRTRETADIINRRHRVPIIAHAALNDIHSGFNGRPVTEYFAATGHDRLNARANGGESLRDYQARALPFLDWLAKRTELTVLVVAHEETLRVVVAHLKGLPDETMERLTFANGEVVEVNL